MQLQDFDRRDDDIDPEVRAVFEPLEKAFEIVFDKFEDMRERIEVLEEQISELKRHTHNSDGYPR